jgi:hypothetical protein
MSEPKDLLLVIEQLRRSNRRWKAQALTACLVLALMVIGSVVVATRARIQAEHARRAELVAREHAMLAEREARDAAALNDVNATKPGQPR